MPLRILPFTSPTTPRETPIPVFGDGKFTWRRGWGEIVVKAIQPPSHSKVWEKYRENTCYLWNAREARKKGGGELNKQTMKKVKWGSQCIKKIKERKKHTTNERKNRFLFIPPWNRQRWNNLWHNLRDILFCSTASDLLPPPRKRVSVRSIFDD